MKSFKDKVVLVTGSTRSIDQAVAKKFAEKGAKDIISGRSSFCCGHGYPRQYLY